MPVGLSLPTYGLGARAHGTIPITTGGKRSVVVGRFDRAVLVRTKLKTTG